MMGRFAWGASVVLLLAALCPAEEPFNVDVFIGWDGAYRPQEWTPVDIQVTSRLKDPFEGKVTVTAQQDSLTNMSVSEDFVVTKDLPSRRVLSTKFAPSAGRCNVTLTDASGRVKWSTDVDLWQSTSSRGSRLVSPRDLLIGVVGKTNTYGLSKLSADCLCAGRSAGNGKVFVAPRLPRALPWDWAGYQGLDLLILNNPDWSAIDPRQARAVRQWVENGGKLLLIVDGVPLAADSPFTEMLGFRLGPPVEVEIDKSALPGSGGRRGEKVTVKACTLTDAPQRTFWDGPTFGARERVFYQSACGFGRVAVLTFSPDQLGAADARAHSAFWTLCTQNLLTSGRILYNPEGRSAEESEPDYGYGSPYRSRRAPAYTASTNEVLGHLLSIPELRPLSIWWVILLLTLLALLLGPVDYLVLRKLDRLPLTWITSTAVIAVFTVGAYYGVQALRAGAMQVRVVSVLDGVEAGPTGPADAWETVYSGIFAPASDDYRLDGLAANQWWSAVAPAQNEDSPYGPRGEIGGRKMYCLQKDGGGGNLPSSLPISIWSMQCLLQEGLADRMPITAEVRLNDDRTVSVKIINTAGAPIQGGCVLFGNQCALFGEVPAEEARQFDNCPVRSSDAYFGRGIELPSPDGTIEVSSLTPAAAFAAQGTVQRSEAIQAYLQHGAAVVCATYVGAPSPYTVADNRSDVKHVQFVRLVVFPKKGS